MLSSSHQVVLRLRDVRIVRSQFGRVNLQSSLIILLNLKQQISTSTIFFLFLFYLLYYHFSRHFPEIRSQESKWSTYLVILSLVLTQQSQIVQLFGYIRMVFTQYLQNNTRFLISGCTCSKAP